MIASIFFMRKFLSASPVSAGLARRATSCILHASMSSNFDFSPENYRMGVILRVSEQKTRRKSRQTGEISPQIEKFVSVMKCSRIRQPSISANFVHLLIFQPFAFFERSGQTPDTGEIKREIPHRLLKIYANGTA
ncbi:hypothetical protein IHQ71_11025 [Rhizobium sp. TH2]|uniref:hypothetical protein n=1 Tax=Rhizobium sp. TH2 TaxID=2775403 RepID=UPI00215741F7|nr:hypothetical protein [Rhizobium sp. TH2]UVC11058.1 hypothetical protein IHQ71_11025 [Rhizobium sp. TH2]